MIQVHPFEPIQFEASLLQLTEKEFPIFIDGSSSDGNGGEDGRIGLGVELGAVSEVEGDVEGVGEAAAPAAAIGPGLGGDQILVGPDKNKKKERGSRGGKLQWLSQKQRKLFLRARDKDDRR